MGGPGDDAQLRTLDRPEQLQRMFYRNSVPVRGHYHRWSTDLCQLFLCNVGFVEPQSLRFLQHNREVSRTVRGDFVVAFHQRRCSFPEGLWRERSDPVQIFRRLSVGIEEPTYANKAFDQVRSSD